MKLTLVCSKSTRKFFPDIVDVFIVKHSPTKIFVDEFADSRKNKIIAVGGGAVMDTAKILGKNIEAFPTTASGSATSEHAVYWDGDIKCSYKSKAPQIVRIVPEFLIGLPHKVVEYTFYDALAHVYESLWSKDATKESNKYVNAAFKKLKKIEYGKQTLTNLVKIIEFGNLAGNAIRIAPTNVMHALSYPMTAKYKIPHGKALGWLIPKIVPYYNIKSKDLNTLSVNINNIDINYIIDNALKYSKIYNTTKIINKEVLLKLLK